MSRWRAVLVAAASLLVADASPVLAQDAPPVSLRPFFTFSEEAMDASKTFNAVFGQASESFYGGGLEVTLRDRVYVDLSASQFKKNGDRVFRTADGHVFHLGIPLSAMLTPLELTGGYRFHPHRRGRTLTWVVPYAGVGLGWYKYRETSQFADDSDNLDTRHRGFLLQGGAEFRLHRWVGIAADVQFTHVPGILGTGGVSKDVLEDDLGGIAGRFKIVVGR
jgi:hypothetical protein